MVFVFDEKRVFSRIEDSLVPIIVLLENGQGDEGEKHRKRDRVVEFEESGSGRTVMEVEEEKTFQAKVLRVSVIY